MPGASSETHKAVRGFCCCYFGVFFVVLFFGFCFFFLSFLRCKLLTTLPP